jgi:hypothetical protein
MTTQEKDLTDISYGVGKLPKDAPVPNDESEDDKYVEKSEDNSAAVHDAEDAKGTKRLMDENARLEKSNYRIALMGDALAAFGGAGIQAYGLYKYQKPQPSLFGCALLFGVSGLVGFYAVQWARRKHEERIKKEPTIGYFEMGSSYVPSVLQLGVAATFIIANNALLK